MKYLIFILFFSFPVFSQSSQTETVEVLNALANNLEDFSKLLKKAEKVLIYKTSTEILDENKTKIRIFAKKIREGDILEGEVIWEIEKNTIPQSNGPDQIRYDSHFKIL